MSQFGRADRCAISREVVDRKSGVGVDKSSERVVEQKTDQKKAKKNLPRRAARQLSVSIEVGLYPAHNLRLVRVPFAVKGYLTAVFDPQILG